MDSIVIDTSNIDMEATYQCKDCKEKMLGEHLLPIIYMELKDDPTHPYGVSKTGRMKCNIRRCCFCRGTVEKSG